MDAYKLSKALYKLAKLTEKKQQAKGERFLYSLIRSHSGPIDIPVFSEDFSVISAAINALVRKLQLNYRPYEIDPKKIRYFKDISFISLIPNFLPETFPSINHITYNKLVFINWSYRIVNDKLTLSLFCSLVNQ